MEFKSESERQAWKQFLRTLNTQGASDRIRLMREHAGVTQKQLAEVAGCQANTISQMENGMILNKETRFIYSICKYFECSIDWLLCETNIPSFDPHTEALAEYLHLKPDTVDQMISILRNLSDSGQDTRRGLNHIITADPASFADLCRCLEEFASAQCVTNGDDINSFAKYEIGKAWKRIEQIFIAAYTKEKKFRETEKAALEQIFS